MKQRLSYVLVVGVIISLFVATPIFAVQDTSTDDTHSTTEEKSEVKTTLEERLTKLKTDLQISLTAAQQARLKSRCKAAQVITGKHKTNFEERVKTRTNAYNELVHHLDEIIPRLKAANIDTTTLEQDKASLETKIKSYNTNLAEYKQALADLNEVDCVTDPTGFKAALESARASHQMLISDAKAIRKYVVETIKVTLQDIRTQLKAKAESNTLDGGAN